MIRTFVGRLAVGVVFVSALVLSGSQIVRSQQQPAAAAAKVQPAAEEMTAESFTDLLKQVWAFLQSEGDAYRESISRKDEFETTEESERRLADRRRQYVANVVKHSRTEKLQARSFWVPFKATLVSYDADTQIYTVSATGMVDAPYNTPTVEATVPANPYLALADSIRRGYRTSTLYLDFKPAFSWKVAPAEARAAKGDEDALSFRVLVKVDIESAGSRDLANLRIVPLEIQFLNTKVSKVYWHQRFSK